jgi:hypothetical protein
MWTDGSDSNVTLEEHVKALGEQVMSADKTREELKRQVERNPGIVIGVAKFKNGNIAFAADNTCQTSFFVGRTVKKLNGKWYHTKPE